MDCADLLARENEFKKLNKQLEKKTESLMKRIESQMQKQDIFSNFPTLSISPVHTSTSRRHSCTSSKSSNSTPEKTPVKMNKFPKNTKGVVKKKTNDNFTEDLMENNQNSGNNPSSNYCVCQTLTRKERIAQDLEFLYAFVSVNVQEKVLPQSFSKDKPTVESVCKFLSNKVKLMQEQIDTLQATLNKKVAQCEKHLSHQAELESERMTLLNNCNNSRTTADSAKAKCNMLQKKLDEKDRLYTEQRSETDRLSSELKRIRSRSAGVEAQRAQRDDIILSLKHKLECAERNEKELRDASRHLSTQHEVVVKELQLKLTKLSQCNRKQTALIVNLKKQRALLTAQGAVEVIEKRFNQMLEHAFD